MSKDREGAKNNGLKHRERSNVDESNNGNMVGRKLVDNSKKGTALSHLERLKEATVIKGVMEMVAAGSKGERLLFQGKRRFLRKKQHVGKRGASVLIVANDEACLL